MTTCKEEILITCDGREMTVRRVGAVKMRLRARADGPPIKPCGWRLVPEIVASAELRALMDTGHYEMNERNTSD
jgi:hypothetical protein